MKQIIAALVALIFAALPAKADQVDSWATYFSYNDASDVIEGDGVLYAVMNGNLFSYDLATTEAIGYDRINSGLSSKGISLIGYSSTQHTLVLVYADGNIDLMNVRNGRVTNIPQFKDNPDSDFALNNLKVCGDNAYIATNEGFICISVSRGIIKGRFPIGGCHSVYLHDGRIYAALKAGGVISIATDDNLLDKSRWERFSDLPVRDFEESGKWLYMACPYTINSDADPYRGVWAYAPDSELKQVTAWPANRMRCYKGSLIAYSTGNVIMIHDDSPLTSRGLAYSAVEHNFWPASAGGYWVARAGGIYHYSYADGAFAPDSDPIKGCGPSYEMPFWMNFVGDRLLMAAGHLDANTDLTHHPFHASWTDDDGEWHDFETPVKGGPWRTGSRDFKDATAVAQDPLDPSHHYITSGCQGLFEYRDGKIVAQYTEGNSRIHSAAGAGNYDYVRCDAPVFDAAGNFFFSNTSVDTVLWCIKRDGRWVPFYHPDLKYISNFEHAIFDTKGRLWISQRRWAGETRGGFLCLDFNNTIDNPNDDIYTYRSIFTNQDGTPFAVSAGYCLAQDRNGRIWMGTDAGLIVCDDPDTWTRSDFLITQVKVPRNDGTNYADYLLDGVSVTAIAIDGADRKWIGTSGDGLYLVSSDGTVMLHHFTTSNSPLVSDNIWSIACHPTNGEVFIGTDVGLMSYHSDASEVSESLERDNLRVYPNPVRPDYSGPVVLDGLVYDSDVKVVSTSGHVVAGGTSVGGTYTWDGRGPSGQRVGSGIYYFMIVTPDGRESTVAKVAVVR